MAANNDNDKQSEYIIGKHLSGKKNPLRHYYSVRMKTLNGQDKHIDPITVGSLTAGLPGILRIKSANSNKKLKENYNMDTKELLNNAIENMLDDNILGFNEIISSVLNDKSEAALEAAVDVVSNDMYNFSEDSEEDFEEEGDDEEETSQEEEQE